MTGGPFTPARGIAAAVELLAKRPARLGRTRLVAVDGPSGSGKTSLAAPLAEAIARASGGSVIRPERTRGGVAGSPPPSPPRTPLAPGAPTPPGSGAGPGPLVAVVSTDLLATWERPLEWWPILEEHLLDPIAAGRTATMPVTEWVSGKPRPGGHIVLPPVDVLVVEGVSSGRRAVAGRLSLLVWVEVPDRGARLERSVARDGEPMRPYLARWQDDEDAHFASDGTRGRADIVIDATGQAR